MRKSNLDNQLSSINAFHSSAEIQHSIIFPNKILSPDEIKVLFLKSLKYFMEHETITTEQAEKLFSSFTQLITFPQYHSINELQNQFADNLPIPEKNFIFKQKMKLDKAQAFLLLITLSQLLKLSDKYSRLLLDKQSELRALQYHSPINRPDISATLYFGAMIVLIGFGVAFIGAIIALVCASSNVSCPPDGYPTYTHLDTVSSETYNCFNRANNPCTPVTNLEYVCTDNETHKIPAKHDKGTCFMPGIYVVITGGIIMVSGFSLPLMQILRHQLNKGVYHLKQYRHKTELFSQIREIEKNIDDIEKIRTQLKLSEPLREISATGSLGSKEPEETRVSFHSRCAAYV